MQTHRRNVAETMAEYSKAQIQKLAARLSDRNEAEHVTNILNVMLKKTDHLITECTVDLLMTYRIAPSKDIPLSPESLFRDDVNDVADAVTKIAVSASLQTHRKDASSYVTLIDLLNELKEFGSDDNKTNILRGTARTIENLMENIGFADSDSGNSRVLSRILDIARTSRPGDIESQSHITRALYDELPRTSKYLNNPDLIFDVLDVLYKDNSHVQQHLRKEHQAPPPID